MVTGTTKTLPDYAILEDCLLLQFLWKDCTVHGFTVLWFHYDDVIMTMLASQITSLTVVYSIVYSGVDQSKHQSSASLAFVQEIHRGPVNFPHKWPVTRKMFPFDDVIMCCAFVISPSGFLSILFSIASLELEKWYDCPNACEVA